MAKRIILTFFIIVLLVAVAVILSNYAPSESLETVSYSGTITDIAAGEEGFTLEIDSGEELTFIFTADSIVYDTDTGTTTRSALEEGYGVGVEAERAIEDETPRIIRVDILEKPIIILDEPEAGETVSSPLVLRGKARGTWYFEATFPVELVTADGETVVGHYAEAQSDWMTEDYVPFEATLEFENPDTEEGTLILHKANASGLPEHDDSREIQVRFVQESE